MAARTLKLLHPASREDIDQLTTRRALPGAELEHLDPFLSLNHHGPQTYPPKNKGLPFATQPQRGFETVTFVLAGSLAHKDSSSGNSETSVETVVESGGVQWLTAGRGLVHSELSPRKFLEKGGAVELLELWVNLPSRWKMTTPRYQAMQKKDLPSHRLGADNVGVDLTPVSGEWGNEFGPFEPITDVALATVVLAPGARLRLPIDAGKAVFFYVISGSVAVGEVVVAEHTLVEWNDDGDSIAVDSEGGARVIVGHGTPFGEPVIAVGPFVMNTDEEIRQAIFDSRSGRMGRP